VTKQPRCHRGTICPSDRCTPEMQAKVAIAALTENIRLLHENSIPASQFIQHSSVRELFLHAVPTLDKIAYRLDQLASKIAPVLEWDIDYSQIELVPVEVGRAYDLAVVAYREAPNSYSYSLLSVAISIRIACANLVDIVALSEINDPGREITLAA
jgi:hypothetical protein